MPGPTDDGPSVCRGPAVAACAQRHQTPPPRQSRYRQHRMRPSLRHRNRLRRSRLLTLITAAAFAKGLAYITRHVIRYHLTREMRVINALYDSWRAISARPYLRCHRLGRTLRCRPGRRWQPATVTVAPRLRPGRYCSPRHRMSLNSSNAGS
jgi:hypothetical protein